MVSGARRTPWNVDPRDECGTGGPFVPGQKSRDSEVRTSGEAGLVEEIPGTVV